MGVDVGFGVDEDVGFGVEVGLGVDEDVGLGVEVGFGVDEDVGFGVDEDVGFGVEVGFGVAVAVDAAVDSDDDRVAAVAGPASVPNTTTPIASKQAERNLRLLHPPFSAVKLLDAASKLNIVAGEGPCEHVVSSRLRLRVSNPIEPVAAQNRWLLHHTRARNPGPEIRGSG